MVTYRTSMFHQRLRIDNTVIPDRDPRINHRHFPHKTPIVANSLASLENSGSYVFFISIGNNGNRKRWFDRLRERKLRIINVVDKSAIELLSPLIYRCFPKIKFRYPHTTAYFAPKISQNLDAISKRWFDRLRERKLRIINVVDKSAIVSPRAQIGDG